MNRLTNVLLILFSLILSLACGKKDSSPEESANREAAAFTSGVAGANLLTVVANQFLVGLGNPESYLRPRGLYQFYVLRNPGIGIRNLYSCSHLNPLQGINGGFRITASPGLHCAPYPGERPNGNGGMTRPVNFGFVSSTPHPITAKHALRICRRAFQNSWYYFTKVGGAPCNDNRNSFTDASPSPENYLPANASQAERDAQAAGIVGYTNSADLP